MQACGRPMGEKEKRNSLSIMKRDRTGDLRVERNSLLCGTALPPEDMVRSQPVLPLRVDGHEATGVCVNVHGSEYH